MKAKTLIFFAACAAMIFNSCGGSNDEPDTIRTIGSRGVYCVLTETDHYTSQALDVEEISLSVKDNSKADFTLKDIATKDGRQTIVIKDIPVEYKKVTGGNDYISAFATDIEGYINGEKLDYLLPSVSIMAFEGKNIQTYFKVNIALEEYIVTVAYKQTTLSGSTRTSISGSPMAPFKDSAPVYVINIDENDHSKAVLDIKGARFAEAMPAMDMTFPDLDIEYKGDSFVLTTEKITPTIGGTPYPDYSIEDLEFTVNHVATVASTLRFKCASKRGIFDVLAVLNY